ncbi:CocE/NonD family hydrolase [Salinisphaera aquimarina]|uniref:CocE/NonD family hydrolase n=1 Tax=Salinisphaera aquimarina TaxID=2094031 RepID=A0ABV7EQZ1_9GAMM
MSELTAAGPAQRAIEACDYDAVVVNPHDGTEIAITVLQPALACGQAAPLIIHGHGFGGARLNARNERSIYEQLSGGLLPSTEAARRAADAGYFVISFDQRGFGESAGNVNIMDPQREGADISAILDWAERDMAHAEHLAYRDDGPVVGALGLSYGGGFQLMGACVDPRFAAIVPTATWHDLSYSLAPDNVVKTAWGAALVALGMPTSGIDLDPVLYRALIEGLASPLTGRGLSSRVADELYNHSPASYFDGQLARDGTRHAAPDQRRPPRVDALLIQGVGDTLFNLNEAVANANGLRATGNDVHLIAVRHGHSLPFLQNIDRIAYQTEADLHWGDQRVETAAIELAYLDWKLKGETPVSEIPHCAVIVDDRTGMVFEDMPRGSDAGGLTCELEGEAVTGGLDLLLGLFRQDTLGGLRDLVAGTVDNATTVLKRLWDSRGADTRADDTGVLAKLVNALPTEHIDELTSGGVFIPLTRIEDDHRAVVGLPRARIEVTGDAPSPVAFVGLGIERPSRNATLLVNDQLRPVRGLGERDIELNGVAERLQAGDRLGLLVYGYHPQYLASFSAIPGRVTVRGCIDIPLLDVGF